MLLPGSRHGRYEIRSLIGAGGMGEVYLAHDAQLQRPVALKVLAGEIRHDEELRKRLEYEARAASALNHPNILTVYDVGTFGEDHFIATEYVDGITLRQRLLRAEPTIDEVLDLAMQIASAITAAEAVGLVHRDIKPDNIMLRGDGYVKLLDFGLARTNAEPEPGVSKTDPYVVRGTVFYMSPEQLRGLPLDSRSDIWSTGVVMYELISGRLPFEGDSTSDVAAAILRNQPPPLTRHDNLPAAPRLAAIVDKAMTKDRARRYQSASELLDDLQRLRAELARDAARVRGSSESRLATTESVTVTEPPPSNLPLRITPLVGRDLERDDVLSLLRRDEIRLVTLTGPGGTGKTRLALALGAELLRDYDDGVWWIPLSSINDPQLVLSEIAETLGLPEGGASLLDAVRFAIREKRMLFVFDNFEQVLDAAPVVAALLAGAPRVKALATSRAPLRISGEREYAVPPLPTPPLDLPMEPDAFAHYPAVALFVERASAVKSDFVLNADNARAIAEICVRLDGLPLAIELAAARVKLLPPKAMLARVENRLSLLSGGARDLPERQQTMRNAISWGYNLLDERDKQLFTTLSVFRGGFTLAEAERLAGDDVLDGISSLLEKSFLRRDPASSEEQPRFTMLATIRDYGLELLREQNRAGEIGRAHAQLMTSIAEECELEPDTLAWDADNFRTALDWAARAGDAELALRLGAALWWSWYLGGHYAEGRRSLETALGVPGGNDVPIRTKVLTGAGALAFLQCDYDHAIELLESSIELARRHGDPMSLAQSLQFRGSIARERGEYDHAIDLHLLSRTIWLELEDVANAGRSLNYVGFASWLNRNYAHTFELCEETLQLFRERRDTEGVAWSLLNLAAASLYSGALDTSEQWLDECLSWSRAGGFREGIAWSLNLLGYVLRARGSAQRAIPVLQDSLTLHWELGDRWRSASVLEALGGLRRDARLLGAAAILRAKLGAPVPPAERSQVEADIEALGARWDGTTEDAVALALR
ncbi:MAG: protein kinase [Acidobacteria bacterium]|nr:protein kinase [Acidobacteriota bacterium]MBV9477080.1 protein kinase [Acidobacteriota bacterium]